MVLIKGLLGFAQGVLTMADLESLRALPQECQELAKNILTWLRPGLPKTLTNLRVHTDVQSTQNNVVGPKMQNIWAIVWGTLEVEAHLLLACCELQARRGLPKSL